MTGLPIIETKANDISAYIPTNVISITDGQIFLEADLFASGVRPAINVGTSVSRVGGSAQVKGMRRVSGRLRLDLAQYRELEAFSAFASDLDKASRAQLDKGVRLVELLKQPQYSPYSVVDETIVIWAGTTGQLDDVPVGDVRRFEAELLPWLRRHRSDTYKAIESSGNLTDDQIESLQSGVNEFKELFKQGDTGIKLNEAEAEALTEGLETHETVTREVRSTSSDEK
jgi:F-type H+-transporting ATPase subunit alpha